MPCAPEILREVPLFSLLDNDELAVLAGQVEVATFAPRQRIYKIGDQSGAAFVLVSGAVRVTTVDEDHQEVVVDEPTRGDLFGFASMINARAHQTSAVATEETVCIQFDRHDITVLLEKKPLAGLDMLAVLGRQFHGAQQLVRRRAARNPNDIIEEEATRPERIADAVASFGGSWTFIISFGLVLTAYTALNVVLGQRAWAP
jgi:CRP-like cAMP-binding protein